MFIRILAVGILTVAAVAWAQGPGRSPRGTFGPDGGARFLGAEAGMPSRVVKNAPYSADAITETTQTLADGNHIRQTSTSRIYRDTEGRTRREQSLSSLQSLAPNSSLPHQVVFINDPVVGANYALNAEARTATKSSWNPPPGRGGRGRGGPNSSSGEIERRPSDPNGTAQSRGFRRPPDQNVKTESLGRQTIEGVQAEGTRTTVTIPAGQIGNEQLIQTVSERWYSPELQTVVLSKQSDPRTGETVFRLANVSRSEPPSTLFQIPVDYKITESPMRGGAVK